MIFDDDPPPDFDAEPPRSLARLRPNQQLTERWRQGVQALNGQAKKNYRFPAPVDITPSLIELRTLPAMHWPAAWPQTARRCRAYPKDLVGIVGPIGGGKTSFAIQMGLASIGVGNPVLWAALELGEEQVLTRVIGNMHGVHAATVRETWSEARINATAASFTDLWRFVDRMPAGTPLPLESQLRAIEDAIELCWRIYGLPPQVVIDHLHKLVAAERDETQALRFAAQALEAMAVRQSCQIVVLAQSSVSNQQALTGRVEKLAAADFLALESGGKAVADAAAVAIALVIFKEDDAHSLDAHAVVAKSRHIGLEGRVGMRFSKPGGVWSELDYLPATPVQVGADIEAKKKDRHRAAPPPSPQESRAELNVIRATDAAGLRRQAVQAALEARGQLGMDLVEVRRIPGAGRGPVVAQALQELERAGVVERNGARWRIVPRYQ